MDKRVICLSMVLKITCTSFGNWGSFWGFKPWKADSKNAKPSRTVRWQPHQGLTVDLHVLPHLSVYKTCKATLSLSYLSDKDSKYNSNEKMGNVNKVGQMNYKKDQVPPPVNVKKYRHWVIPRHLFRSTLRTIFRFQSITYINHRIPFRINSW